MNDFSLFRHPVLAGSLAGLSVFLSAADARAQTLRVSTYGLDSSSGVSWSSALRTLRAALNRAATDPTITRIEVAAGTYKPGGSRSSSFDLVSGVTVVGGYPAAGGTTSDPDTYATILSGDIGVAGDISDNCYTVVLALGVTGARLEGFRIRHGNSDGATTGPFAHGGGLYAENSSLVVTRCRFYENQARIGGAVSLWNASATFSRCRFTRNFAGLGGGAMGSSVGRGASDVLIERSWFVGNFGQTYGGAIWNDSEMSVYDSVFSGNQALGYGGAVCTTASVGVTRICNCTSANNRAAIAGGAYYDGSSGGSALVNSIFWHDTASGATTEIAPAGVGIVHHCDVEGLAASGVVGYANTDVDPELVDEFGPDGVAGTSDDDPRIRRASPCVNAGDNAAVPVFAEFDIDDGDRIQRPFPHGPAIVDVGANEIAPLSRLFPGSAADLDMHIEVDGSDAGIDDTDAMAVRAGSRLAAVTRSPNGSLIGLPCVVTVDVFVGGRAPSLPGMPEAHFGPGAVVLFFPALPAEGLPLIIDPVPPGLTGSMMIQGLVLSPLAANGRFFGSRGRELRFD